MDENNTNAPRNVLPDLIIPAMALAFTIYYLTTITEVPWIAQASAIVVSGLLLASILAFVVRTAYRLHAGTEYLGLSELFLNRGLAVRRVILLGLAAGYVWFIDSLGFTLATLIFLFLAIMTLAGPAYWRKALLASIVCSLIGYFVFIFVFETRFPEGHFEHFVEGVFDGR